MFGKHEQKWPFVIFFLLCCICSPFVNSDDVDGSILINDEPTFEQRLSELNTILREKEKEKKNLQKELRLEQDTVTKEQLQQELDAATDIIIGVRQEIVSLSTGGMALFSEPAVVTEEFNWQRDLESIFKPLLSQLREISERPRLIEKLETDISYWQQREKVLSLAIKNLEYNMGQVESAKLKRGLRELFDTANSRSNTAKQKLSLLNNELEQLKQSKNPIWSTLGTIFSNIIIGIVLHFFVAVLASILMYQMIKMLSLLPIAIINKAKKREVVFAERAIVVGRTFLGALLSVLIYFVILYSFAEWLLLVISALIIAAITLGLKDAIPNYFVEAKTLLNMGSIRQGERLYFQGLSWRINRLNVHTRLHNPALHGHLRVPLTEIVNCSSRPYHSDEPWFPTKVGDVVLMEDDVFGKVVRQSPDVVELNRGESIYYYKTRSFLSRTPRNLSKGFTVYESFGFDYQHQSDITSILTSYRISIKQYLEASEFSKYLMSCNVEFDQAAASSLNFKILASFDGQIAEDYFKIKRFLQKVSVDIANDNKWVIPFEQMTVHQIIGE